MPHKLFISFGIYDFEDISHDEISKIMELQPSKIFIKGERRHPNFLIKANENSWIIHSNNYGYGSFEEQMNSLISLIESKKHELKEFKEKYYLEISCALRIAKNVNEYIPSIYMTREMLEILGALSISVDYDVYLVEES